jgi:hypothetical protein
MCRSTKSFNRCIGCARKKKAVGLKPACGACATLSTAALQSACIQGYITFGDQPLGGCSTSPDANGRIDVHKLEACIKGISNSCRQVAQQWLVCLGDMLGGHAVQESAGCCL